MKTAIILSLIAVTACFAITPAMTSFNTGQVSPLMEARNDFSKYNSACRTIENMLVTTQGPVTKRPGTKYIATSPMVIQITSEDYPTLRLPVTTGVPAEPNDIALVAPTHITDAAGLAAITGSGHYILDNDIDLDGVTWTPIANFAGVLDGNDHTVSNLTIDLPAGSNYTAMFGKIANGAQIRNVTLTDVNVTGWDGTNGSVTNGIGTGTAALIAYAPTTNDAIFTVKNVSVSGVVRGAGSAVGGLIGQGWGISTNSRSVFYNCTSSCTVTAGNVNTGSGNGAGGGFVGSAKYCNFINCSSTGDSDIAGSTANMGAFIGTALYSSFYNCYTTGNCTTTTVDYEGTVVYPRMGGFAGRDMYGSYLGCYATGDIVSFYYAGGFIAENSYSTILDRCYTTSDITLPYDIPSGGFLALSEGIVTATNCYARGDVTCLETGNNYTWGGFFGENSSEDNEITITNCYSTGAQLGLEDYTGGFSSDPGGFMAQTWQIVDVNSCYWDTQTSGFSTSYAGTGKTTDEMKTQSTYNGWDFDTVWFLDPVEVRDNATVRLVPFEYSTDDSYILECGNQYMRFYREGGQILSGGEPYEIETKFEGYDLFNIQYAQADNVMYLVDGNNPPQKLSRSGHTSWTIEDVNFDDGPFLPENTSAITINPSSTTTATTLTASSAIFNAGHVGSIWQINQKRGSSVYNKSSNPAWVLDANESTGNSAFFTGGYSFTTSGTFDATVTLERSTNSGTTWEAALAPLNSSNFNNPAENESEGAIYRVTMSDYVSGTCNCTLTISDQMNHGVVKITGYTSGTVVTGWVLKPLIATTATKTWREGYWSDYRGWPKTVEFHQQRLVFGSSTSFPQTIWFGESNPDDYENFDEGTLDTDAFTVALPGQNPIQWLLSQEYLFIGTSGSAGKYGDQGKAITPTSPNYREQAKIGSERIKAVLAGEAILYVERGAQKVREFTYSLQQDKYLAPDLTILSDDITSTGIKTVAFQSRPNPILWCVLKDGDIAALSYQRDQDVIGWTKTITAGAVESVAVIPGDTEDEVWVSVKRLIGGTYYRYIEQFQPRDFGDDVNDCWFVDSGLSYDGTAISSFTGLTHLIGRTVTVLGDGVIMGNEVVDANGAITIDRAASRVTAGLAYTSKLETLPIVFNNNGTSTAPMNTKVTAVDFDLFETGYCKYGNGPYSTLNTINFSNDTAVDPNAVAQPLYTSETAFKHVMFPYGSKKKQTIYVESNKPLPLTIRAIIPTVEIVSN